MMISRSSKQVIEISSITSVHVHLKTKSAYDVSYLRTPQNDANTYLMVVEVEVDEVKVER